MTEHKQLTEKQVSDIEALGFEKVLNSKSLASFHSIKEKNLGFSISYGNITFEDDFADGASFPISTIINLTQILKSNN